MTEFNIIFGVSFVVVITNLLVILLYVRQMSNAMSLSDTPLVTELLKNNSHFNNTRRRAARERHMYTTLWLPVLTVAALTIADIWWLNYQTQTLTSLEILSVVFVLTLTVARPYTHAINREWLTAWSNGMYSAIYVVQMHQLQRMINDLEAITNPTTAELQQLAQYERTLSQLRQATGIESLLPGCVDEE